MATYGETMFNALLPEDLRMEGAVTKKRLSGAMVTLAKRDPEEYARVIQEVKHFGDEVSTLEGISVGLDDIAPDYARRDPIMQDALRRIKATDDPDEKRKILTDTEKAILAITSDHESEMALMARSGGRGSVAQLMKTVGSPVAVTDSSGEVVPWLVDRSYSQGLSPGSFWIAASEARRNAIKSTNSVVEPGAVAKVVVTNMEGTVVVGDDCGTHAGIEKTTDDHNIVDRYLAEDAGAFTRGTLITTSVSQEMQRRKIKKILVRSPMTCDENDGVCQRCMGVDAYGADFGVGDNVGVRAAQAITEPLTQFSLDAKHGVRLTGGGKKQLAGLRGFRVLTEVPKSFTQRAQLAKQDGVVSNIEEAPQGGHYITVAGERHYTPPGLRPLVKRNQHVERGDILSEGTPMPNEIVEAKGIGEGRRFMSESVNQLFARQGVNIDHRHTELLARNAMKYVKVTSDPSGEFLEGDTVPFNAVQRVLRKGGKEVSLNEAAGQLLAAPLLHYTEGTRLTPSVIAALKTRGVSSVSVAQHGLEIQPIMKSLVQTPLLDQSDWLGRLSHRYLKKTILEGAAFGATTNLQSTSPVAAFVADANFGSGAQGKYAAFDLEKIAATLGRRALDVGKKVLFGGGADGVGSALRPRVVTPWGAADAAGVNARRVQKAVGDDAFQRLNIVDNTGAVTDQGDLRLRELMNQRRNIGSGTSTSPTVMDRIQGKQPKHNTLGEEASSALQEVGLDANSLTPDQWEAVNAAEGGGLKSMARLVKGFMLGEAPVEIAKQRFQQGGLIGKGGVVLGDLAIDRDVVRGGQRALDSFRSGDIAGGAKHLGRTAFPATMETGNKYFSYVVPGAAAIQAAQAPDHPEESRLENVVAPLADIAGWGLGGSLGALGGAAVAGQVQDAARGAARYIDPKTRALDAATEQKAQAAQAQQRTQQAQQRAQAERARRAAFMPQRGGARLAPPVPRYTPQPVQRPAPQYQMLQAPGEVARDTRRTFMGHPLFGMANLVQDAGQYGYHNAREALLPPVPSDPTST